MAHRSWVVGRDGTPGLAIQRIPDTGKMNQKRKTLNLPAWYWVIAVLALLWNLMGCFAFLMELFAQDSMMKSWTEEQKDWARSIPRWIYILYGIAVATGVAGSISLLRRKAWSVPLFACCFVAVIVQMVYTTLIAGGLQTMGPSSLVMPALVIAFATGLLWFSWFAKGRAWLA